MNKYYGNTDFNLQDAFDDCLSVFEGLTEENFQKADSGLVMHYANEIMFALEFALKNQWIPIKYRPLTPEERIEFAEYYGIEYCDTVSEKAFDCHMPEDGQEILISGSCGVSIDIADNDIDCGFIVYGLEGNGDWEGIDAWMPLPEPYKE